MESKVKKKGKSTWKKVNDWLHLWLGLVSGIIVFVVCLTGVIFVFHDEVTNMVNNAALTVEVPADTKRISADSIVANLKKNFPDVSASSYTEFNDPSRSIKMMIFDRSVKAPFRGMGTAYANPYTGEILKVDHTYGFFRWMAAIHTNLLLGKVGSHIVQIATVIFLIELITGLIWWWPKKWTKATKEKSFTIKWGASWKRINLDLHNVLGFYSLILALILTVTGVVLSYEPVKKVVFGVFGSSGKEPSVYKLLPKADSLRRPLDMEQLLAPHRQALASYNQLTMGIPNPRSGSVFISQEIESSMVTYRGKRQFLDVYTGKVIPISEASVQDAKMMNMNIALHIGTWYGLPAKIITFIVCLICTSLPITGFIIWYNRKFKKKKSKNKGRSPSVVRTTLTVK